MSLFFIVLMVLTMTGFGYAFFLLLRWLEMPDLLTMQYHYWREEMRRVLKE